MPELRAALADFGDVRSYMQSGNVVLSSERPPEEVRRECERLIEQRFGLAVDVIIRTRDQLDEVSRRNPLGDVATDPRRYLVTFLDSELAAGRVAELAELATGNEQLVADRRELYTWHPNGVARSKLWAKLASPRLGVTATSRNWRTVSALAEIAGEE
jgi:uncharacterized protein (DUF1697 family)